MSTPLASPGSRPSRSAMAEDRRLLSTVVVFSALLIVCSMDLWQLVFAASGALMYALVQALSTSSYSGGQQGKKGHHSSGGAKKIEQHEVPSAKDPPPRRPSTASGTSTASVAAAASSSSPRPSEPAQAHAMIPAKQPSVKPVAAPKFASVGFDSEVDELVRSMAVSERSERIVQRVARAIERIVRQSLPEAKVVGFINGDLACGAAFRVAVPEVDIVVCTNPLALGALQRGGARQQDAKSLDRATKGALRSITDGLIGSGRFKFRRSTFRSDEPKVTLHVPPEAGLHDEAVAIEVSINSTTPGFHAALFAEAGHLDARAQALLLLVKRWAKDRGVCHAAKGHLSPYAWTLLTIFFLQVGVEDEGPLLPPFTEFRASSSLAPASTSPSPSDAGSRSIWKPLAAPKKTVGALFKDFARFYARAFDFRSEAVSIRTGKRGPPSVDLAIACVLHEDGATTGLAPSIEDPFSQRRNLGDSMNELGLQRLREELARADELCASGAPLGELLAPWAPPERTAAAAALAAP